MMKKRIIIFSAIFAALCASCAIDPLAEEDGRRGTTTITFTPDFGDIAAGPDTKAFDVNPQVRNLYLAVFNEGGTALVEYVKAESVQLATTNGTQYSYKAALKVTDKKRVVHLIANAPEEIGYGSAEDAVGGLLYNFDTDNWTGQDAYWGYLELPNGICAPSDVAGCNALIAKFSEVKLVRNFAQIKVSAAAGSNFTVTRFWISNFPDRASAAPYNRDARRFETTYSGYSNALAANTAGYEGFCPATAGLVSLKGLGDKLDDIACAPGGTAFTYEREVPVSDPLCIIVEGKLTGNTDNTFYKIDLRDNNGKYIPILRNFIYEVTIGNVLKVGEPSVEAALNSVSSGAIDTDLSLKDLKDLSNGKSRIAVSETERVLFNNEHFKLFYTFVPDISTGTVVNKTLADWVAEGTYDSEQAVLDAHEPYVSVARESHGESGNVIDSFTVASIDESDGYRAVNMVPVLVGATTKTEVFLVTGHVWNGTNERYETLQRTVSYQMRERPDIALTLTPDRVQKKVGESITLTIGLEENLPKSLFTVDLKITTDQMTLTPADNNLSISTEVGADGKPAFFMKKAITWEEYSSTPSVMDGDGTLRKHFNCQFKTNTDNFREVDESFGDGDRLYVKSEDFNMASIFFIAGDDTKNRFVNPHLDKDYLVAGRSANIIFGMTNLPSDGKVFVRLKGLEPADTGVLEKVEDETTGEYAGYTVYSLDVDDARSESFAVKSKDDAASGYFQLFHDEFNNSAKYEYVIQKASFSNLKFNYNDLDYVVVGKQALVTFHMDYTPLDGKVTLHLKNVEPVDKTLIGTGPDTDGYTSYVIDATTNDVSFPVNVAPELGETKAYFKLTADNFNDSDKVSAPIQKLNFSNLKIVNPNNTDKNHIIGGKPARIEFTLDDMPGDGVITIKLTNLTLGSGRTGVSAVTDKGSGKYDLTVTGTSVTLDVTPTVGAEKASYELTDSEFNDADSEAAVYKLNFNNVRIVNEYSSEMTYLIGGRQARIYFDMEELPTDGTITLALTDLSLESLDPTSGKMSGISAISGGDGTYELTVSGTNVFIDVKPTIGGSSAKVDLTDDQFNTSSRSVTIGKLNFSGLTITNADPADGDKDYLIIGKAARMSFSMDDVPLDGKVSIKLFGMTEPVAVSGISAIESKGSDEYELTVTGTNASLDATVATGATSAGFNLSDPEFLSSAVRNEKILTRYTIDWSKVQIKGKLKTAESAAKNVDVEVYTSSDFSGYPAYTIHTGEDGKASGTLNIDSETGTESYFFKFNDSIGEYRSSSSKTLSELASNTDKEAVCSIQTDGTHTFKSGEFKVTLGGDSKFKGSVSWLTQSGYSDVISMGNNSGQNNISATITCTSSEIITFTCNGYSGSYKISEVTGKIINLTK